MAGYVLSIDCGTQSLRSIIFDSTGQMLAKDSVSFEPYYSTKPGFAEQDPYVYWDALCQTTNTLKSKNSEEFNRVDTVCVTAQRDTCVCLDKDGEPVRDLISWADERLVAKPRVYSKKNQLALKIVGMFKVANLLSRQCHGHWIEDYEPENWAKTHKYVQLSGFLNTKLTGEFKDGVASQVGHIPFNYKKRIWEKPNSMKGQLFQLGMSRMVDLVETTGILGYITSNAASETGLKIGLPVIAAGSDKGCETLGVGCNDNETVSISLGSQATVQASSDKYYEVQSFIPPFPGVNPARYNPEIQIYRGYWMISWFKNEFAHREQIQAEKEGISPEQLLDSELQHIQPGADGLILQPYWGAGLKSPEARGSIIGFSDYHTRIHIYRAIIEGIGFALLEGMQMIEKKSGYKIRKIMISGGGSSSNEICQITADIFNLPVFRVQTYETSALGASMVGYVANGTFSNFDEATKAMVHEGDVFDPDEKNQIIYNDLYHKVYKKLYKKMKPFYKEIGEII